MTGEADDILTWGAVPAGDDRPGRWRFGIWAPGAERAELRFADRSVALHPAGSGTWTATFDAEVGETYDLRLDGETLTDPAARWLDTGVDGPARLWQPPVRRHAPPRSPRRNWAETSIMELHVGTFTDEGTFAAAAEKMGGIAALGITAVELMPVNAFAGEHGWGYDGVQPFAPHPAYGTPDDLVALVDAIHDAGMCAFLDVVYNHFGPEGLHLHRIAPGFFDPARHTPWGAGIDYTRPEVRAFFLQNAVTWCRDYGFDGLRLDAVHQVGDPSPTHLFAEMRSRLDRACSPRVILIAEDERNLTEMRDAGVTDANWNDDYHHAVHCLLTGESDWYYAPFAVDPIEDLCRALAEGQVEQGQTRPGRAEPRGAPSGHLPASAFVNSNQTHDQVGNRVRGDRLLSLADPRAVRIAYALLLTAPAVPMLFMGEEAGSRAPFPFFADFGGELGQAVREGRARELEHLPGDDDGMPDPLARETFVSARPHAALPDDAAEWRALTRRCLDLRAERIAPLLRSRRLSAEARPTGRASLEARWTFAAGRLDIVAHLGTAPENPRVLDQPDLALGNPDAPHHIAVKVTRT
ncbi:malto-oligosyltrehalose trehalohydrolase [Rhodobacterales bacterium HKCCE2091]|nr:malto-oligosyltrehalose trehalohydrolase [Rhodobacterales bacterium HKCCE2091]